MSERITYAGLPVPGFDRAYLWHYRARWLEGEYLDGDTYTALVDTGFHGREEVRIRLPDRYSPERYTPGGAAATEELRVALQQAVGSERWNLRLVTRQLITKPNEATTLERYVADTYLVTLSSLLVALSTQLAANAAGTS